MGQVPRTETCTETFIIVGRGRVARHLAHYFTLEGLSFRTYNRHEPLEVLKSALLDSTHVLLAISDAAIEPFCVLHASLLEGRRLAHFSGSLVTPLAAGAHPLMTFANDFYPLDVYRSISFITDGAALTDILPGLKNPSYSIDSALKPLYHAWCVMSGNFSTLLWEGFFHQLESRFGLPRAVAFPYLQQLTANLTASSAGASVLTGPLVRGDQATLERNFKALQNEGSAYAPLYTAFVDSYRRDLQ